jgi:hypothetical protein
LTDPNNPTVDEVFTLVSAQIVKGSQLPLTEKAQAVVPKRFRNSFEERLKTQGTWARDQRNVLNAARQLGVVAAAIASLRQQQIVEQDVMETATEIVQQECKIGFTQGIWCS